MARRLFVAGLVLLFAVATNGTAAPPTVPTSLPYQGLLLDGLGAPRTGSVDLTVRIYDGIVGGTLVYKQSFPGIALADGVFTVQLGPAGEGSDAPSNPLTTDLATALSGDAGPTAPVRFLEVTVGGDGALSRTQILASAYAIRAASAATADTAANATNVGGVAGLYVTEFFEQFNADGAAPPNYDASEGVADTDGDGILNFVDTDNDNDGLLDGDEVVDGSDINLTTPSITQIAPATGSDVTPTAVTVTGTSFQLGQTFTIGSQTPAISNLTATSFQATVAPQPSGAVSYSVTIPNGQGAVVVNGFTFVSPPPGTIPATPHGVTLGATPANAAGYDLAIKPGTTEILLGGHKMYAVGDAAVALIVHPLASRGAAGQIAVAYDASNRASGLRCRDLAPTCVIEVLTDLDADGELEDETGTAIETLNGTATIESAQLERDPTAGWVAGYVRRAFAADAVVVHDRNGDGDFADANEKVVIEPAGSLSASKSALAVDAAGHVAYAYFLSTVGVRLAWDRNGDGDFADTITGNPELVTLPGVGLDCFDLAFDPAGHLAVAYQSFGQKLSRDLNDDGDFADAGETVSLGATSSCPEVAMASAQPAAVAFSSDLRLDRNADGDFDDSAELAHLAASIGNTGDLKLNGTNRAIAVGTTGLYLFSTDPP